jgi:CxxC motif-containing protein (DUF1111 family)
MFLVLLSGCGKDAIGPDIPPEDRSQSGGATTINNATSQAFTFPAPNLADLDRHLDGDLAFDAAFVSAPATVNPGLGPIFNNNACVACHVGNGRGAPPAAGQDIETLLVRLSVPGTDAHGGPLPVPGFGLQLNDKAVFGVVPEAQVQITWTETQHQFADGTPYALRRPQLQLVDPYMPLPAGLMTSIRVAPPVFGRGLLEAIPEADIVARADEMDADGDGISGRPNRVFDVLTGRTELGRFGLKANQPSLLQQAAAAYRNDMGVTNPLFPTDSATGQSQDDGEVDDPELAIEIVEAAAFYTQTLAVPARRRLDDAQVVRGEFLFEQAGCASCHTPRFTTGVLEGLPAVSEQVIYPFTDMLLHDMGEELADGRPDFLATGSEWRTPPLWGIGLTGLAQGHTFFLHDGRARNLLEAVMWHAGEAEAARDFVHGLPAADRQALMAFLQSL